MKTILLLLALAWFHSSHAQELSATDQKALQETLQLLRSPEQRREAIQGDEKAMKADAHAKSVGGAHSEEVYALAAQVFEKLVKKYNGDVNKLNEVMEQAQRDPTAFARSEFTEEELKALRELAQKLGPIAGGKK